jgi:Toprim domain
VIPAAEISRALAYRIGALAPDLLPGGHREGAEWRAGSLAGEAGASLGIHLIGSKAGVWSDFATGEKGDALDLVRAALDIDMTEAIGWAARWLGIEKGDATVPARSVSAPKPAEPESEPDRWRYPWQAARPIAGTLAETYLRARGLNFDDADGRVLRFARRRARKHPETGELEYHPALLCALSDAKNGERCGLVNIYLQPDGRDRLRDAKGKTNTGRALGAVVMLSGFDEPVTGLILCEGVETGITIFKSELRPVWACGGAGKLATFPVLGGIEALTIAADADKPGQKAAQAVAGRWREAAREAVIVAPPTGDWADGR